MFFVVLPFLNSLVVVFLCETTQRESVSPTETLAWFGVKPLFP